jgi:hypothetical protein
VKQAIFTVTPRFSARRMVKDYVTYAYAPAFKIAAPDRPERTVPAGTAGEDSSASRRVLTRPID